MLKKTLSVLLCAVMIFGGAAVAFAADGEFDSFGAYDHVIICGIDRLMP